MPQDAASISRETAALVGQSMMVRFEGPVFTDEAKAAFAEIRPGGVLYFGDNITSREQARDLSAELQAEAKRLGMPPLLIAIDQEGGIVSRFSPDMVTVPGAMALTADGDPADIETAARITGEQLRAIGVNVDFAPVVDVNNNPKNPVIRTRSFGDTVDRVIDGALAQIRGYGAAGIASTVKHFPGHGDTNVDSHLGLPVIAHPRTRLDEIELAPFRAAIAAGVSGVMTTHILFPAIDDDPATLSRPILTGILRHELGFEGVIYTDSLSMQAIEDRYGHGVAAVRCKLAGVDMLEANEPIAHQLTRFHALATALDEGRIPAEVFTATNARLDALRARYGITGNVPPLDAPDPAWESDAVRIAAHTIVALPEGEFEPLPVDTTIGFIDFQRLRSSEAEDPFNRAGVFRQAAEAMFPHARVVALGHEPGATDVQRAIAIAGEIDALVVMTRDATDNTDQVDIASQAIAATPSGARVIHVALRGPYDRGLLGPVEATILTFGDPAVTLRALPAVLAGERPLAATMPVALA